MKQTSCIVAALLLLVGLGSCSQSRKQGYTLHGEIDAPQEGFIYLQKYEDKSFVLVDSAPLVQGKFTFRGSTEEPLIYGLTTVANSRQPLLFFLDNEEINLRLSETEKQIEVSGSPLNDLYFSNLEVIEHKGYRLDSLVQAHPESPVGPYLFMRHFAWQYSLDRLQALRSAFAPSLQGSFYVNQIDTLIARKERLQVGAVAPDFTLPDTEGHPVSLSSFRGQYVWVDFWASWCPDCRRENPNIVVAYERFRHQNFTVLGVSLDRKKEPWLAAIEKDGLQWTHVSDLKDWKSDVAALYAIRWIPTGFLINPDGVILASGLEGEALHKKLQEVLE